MLHGLWLQLEQALATVTQTPQPPTLRWPSKVVLPRACPCTLPACCKASGTKMGWHATTSGQPALPQLFDLLRPVYFYICGLRCAMVWCAVLCYADLGNLMAARAAEAAPGSGSGQGRESSSSSSNYCSQIKSQIRVPRLNGGKMGVLATRSPHRPVPIGLSTAKVRDAGVQTRQDRNKRNDANTFLSGALCVCVLLTHCLAWLHVSARVAVLSTPLHACLLLAHINPHMYSPSRHGIGPLAPLRCALLQIVSVDEKAGVLVLGGVDVVDGSPVLDIKPYVPFSDALPDASAPDWVRVRG